MKIFISHKKEDALWANALYDLIKRQGVDAYLDVLDPSIVAEGKALTDHIKAALNQCTDIIVVMSENTRYSQWVPFEVGMSAQIDMPTATFLQKSVSMPSFLQYWPRLSKPEEVILYISTRKTVEQEMRSKYGTYEFASRQKTETETFYARLKPQLGK